MPRTERSEAAEHRSAVPRFIVGLIVAFFPFAANADFILDHFYRRGALLYDSGILSHAMARGGPALLVGQAVGNESFFSHHIVPTFTLIAFLAGFLRLSAAQIFAIYTGLSHALLAIGAYWLLTGLYGMRRGVPIALAGLLALAFGFNGLALAMIKYPHFETLIPASIILFLISWSQGRLGLAALFFLVALVTREDAGFHIFAILAVLMALDRWQGYGEHCEKGTIAFLAGAFIYSLAALLVQGYAFPDASSLRENYFGEFPLSQVNGHLLAVRFLGYFMFRGYIMIPAMCAIGWAAITRNPYILVGYVAFLPWLILQLISPREVIGTMPYYYGYPFLIAAIWPLIGIVLWTRRTGRPVLPQCEAILGFAVIVAFSFVGVSLQANPAGADLLPAFASIPSLTEERAVDHAIAVLHAAHGELGRVAAEDGVAALATGDFTQDETFWPAPPTADTVLYFPLGYRAEAARNLADAAGLTHRYTIAGTPIVVRTDRTLADMPTLAPLLTQDESERR